ncbi:MAG TPA: hypothetical protein VGK73_03200 [Polyangiaceae bacterium]
MRQHRTTHRFRPGLLRSLSSLAVLAGATGCAQHPAEPPASGATPSASAADTPLDPAAQGVVDRRGKGGASVFVAHMVSDFEGFKKFFEEGAAERVKAGVKGHLLTRLDDGRVVIHLFAGDLPAVKMTLESPALQEYLSRSGSPDASLVWLAHDEFIKLPATPPTGQTFSLYYKLRASDLPALRRGFVELQPVFAEQGVIGSGLHQSVAHADLMFLHFMGTARDKLEALSKRPEFEAWLSASGATEPKSFLGEDLSRSRTE